MQLKILSWNVWFDGHFDEISRLLKASGADIIGLQEVVPDDPTRDIINYLARLGYHHVFSPVLKLLDGRTMGNAIFSKYEIIKSETRLLSKAYSFLRKTPISSSRSAVRADVKMGEIMLHVFNTHLLHTHQKPSKTQTLQVESFIKLIPPTRTIIMGDFNATPDSAVIQKMQQVMATDSTSTPTWSVYPEGCRICNPQAVDIRLDYIFTSKDIKTNSFQVQNSKGSDHLPISVMVEI